MVDRIVEAFTKPKMEITAIDEFIQGLTILGIMFLIFIICILIGYFIKKIKESR